MLLIYIFMVSRLSLFYRTDIDFTLPFCVFSFGENIAESFCFYP